MLNAKPLRAEVQQHILVGVLSLHTSRPSTTKWTVQGKVNVLLAVHSNNEGWYIDNLLAHPATQQAMSMPGLSRESVFCSKLATACW